MKKTLIACTLLLTTLICRAQTGTPVTNATPDLPKAANRLETSGVFFVGGGLCMIAAVGFEVTGNKDVSRILMATGGASLMAGGVYLALSKNLLIGTSGNAVNVAVKF